MLAQSSAQWAAARLVKVTERFEGKRIALNTERRISKPTRRLLDQVMAEAGIG